MGSVVGIRKATVSLMMFSLVLFGSLIGVVFASSSSWVEVTRFAGKVDVARLSDRVLNVNFTTESFTCNNVEWRIRWNFSPAFIYGGGGERRSGLFTVNVYQTDNNKQLSSSIGGVGTELMNGTWIHNENGTFYLHISTLFAYDYSIIIEQNVSSIPEFPSLTIPVACLSAVLVLTIIYRSNFIQDRKK